MSQPTVWRLGASPPDEELLDALAGRLAAGEVGALPTDTLYGLTGDGRAPAVIERINRIKRRAQPATLIPPDEDWAVAMARADKRDLVRRLLRDQPGATLLVPFAPEGDRTPAPALTATGLLGLRVPRHWIASLASRAGIPLVTTSVNRTGEAPLTEPAAIEAQMGPEIDFLVDGGPIFGRASRLIFLDEDEPRIVER